MWEVVIQQRKESPDPLRCIYDLDNHRQIVGNVDQTHRMQVAVQPEAFKAAEDRRSCQAFTPCQLDDGNVGGFVIVAQQLMEEDP
jgi:hypothetical protein